MKNFINICSTFFIIFMVNYNIFLLNLLNIKNKAIKFYNIIDSFTKPHNKYNVVKYSKPATSLPKANISKDDKGYQVSLAAPGRSRSDFNVEVSDNVLTVSTENDYKNENSLRQEFSYNKFSRSWSLPENTDFEGITAKYEAGILSLNIPTEEVIISKTKKIEVN